MKRLLLILSLSIVANGQEVRRALPVGDVVLPFDEQAKFLVGIPVAETSPLAPLQQTAFYREHAAGFEKLWSRYNQNYFSPMRLWSLVELAPRISTELPVIYFFGGPDALAVRALYPDASDYILGGLEPVGSMPPPESLDGPRVQAALGNLRKSTEVILSYGHFITKDMKAEFEVTDFRGVLPVMMAFLAMSGSEVLDVSYFGVDAAGRTEEYGTTYRGGNDVLPGVRITFRTDALAPPRRIHYVQANVADDVLASNGAATDWAAGFGPGNVYLKAASYLMHETYFSRIRKFLLERGQSVVQDDSGIPLKFFRDGSWRLWFFGNYTGTLDTFKRHWQQEMADAFKAEGAPLPFGTGYKWRLGESNLLLAVKQPPPKAEPVSAPSP